MLLISYLFNNRMNGKEICTGIRLPNDILQDSYRKCIIVANGIHHKQRRVTVYDAKLFSQHPRLSFVNSSKSFLLSYRCSTKWLLRKKCLISHSCTYLTLDSSRVALRNIRWHSLVSWWIRPWCLINMTFLTQRNPTNVRYLSQLWILYGQRAGYLAPSKLRRKIVSNCRHYLQIVSIA